MTAAALVHGRRFRCLAACDRAERMVLLSFRWWVLGWAENAPAHWARVWRGFREEFAGEATEALSDFARFLQVLRCEARRPIHYRIPGCGVISADEGALIHLIGACQHSRAEAARAMARRFVRERGVAPLADAGARFAEAMARAGLLLPAPAVACELLARLRSLESLAAGLLADRPAGPEPEPERAPPLDLMQPWDPALLEILGGERI